MLLSKLGTIASIPKKVTFRIEMRMNFATSMSSAYQYPYIEKQPTNAVKIEKMMLPALGCGGIRKIYMIAIMAAANRRLMPARPPNTMNRIVQKENEAMV